MHPPDNLRPILRNSTGNARGNDARSRGLLSRLDRALNLLDNPRVVFIFLIPVLLQWIVPLVRSRFWLDESVTWWATNHGFRELITRCTFWPGSIFYNSFLLLLRSLGAHREWVLRVPSLLGVALAAGVLFDLGRRWFSQRVATAGVVFFCAQQWVSFAAADARPYGLGLLAVVTATWLMLRWLETQRLTEAIAYGVVGALIVHFHMLFATVLIFHIVFLCFAMPRNRPFFRQALVAGGMMGVLILPLLPQYVFAFTGKATHTFFNPRTLWDLLRQILPTVAMLASAMIAALLPRLHRAPRATISRQSLLLSGLWACVPLILLFSAAKLTGSDLFVGRYALPYVPGIALCFGIVLEYLSPRLRTGLVLLVFLIPSAIACLRGEFASHTTWGNWAGAIGFIDAANGKAATASRLPVMMRSPFPESDFFEWRTVRMNDSALYSPLAYYATSSEWRPLPVTFNAAAALAIDKVVAAQPPGSHGLYFAAHEDAGVDDPYVAYLRSNGNLETLGDFEGVRVFRLQW